MKMQSMPTSGSLTPDQFVEKWSRADLSERAASHEHFLDLCHLLNVETPAQSDATGQSYTFEKHVKVVGAASKGSKGDDGFVDVWKKGHFAWEYKRKGKYKDLDEAYRQLYQYRDDLNNPYLSIVCDIKTTEIRTHFPGFPTQKVSIKLEEIPAKLEVLRRVFKSPESFRPTKTKENLTKELAKEFGELADRLIDRYPIDELHLWESAGSPVAHFLMKVMFCLFAEDVTLLPANTFTKLINHCLFNPEEFEAEATNLFSLMRQGGRFGYDTIPWFNGGLFDQAPALPLKHGDLTVLRKLAGDSDNWAGVEPSIFGTLFERILDPKNRAQIGAHYTSRDDILLVIDPVIMRPLRRKWSDVQSQMQPHLDKMTKEPDRKKRDVLSSPVRLLADDYRNFLSQQRILDPACGSGNFLYVALQQLLDLEDEVVRFCARHAVDLNPVPKVSPTQMHGIEINPYAAELAQVVIWIGYLQWLHIHGIDNPRRPILDKLQNIENRDAILDLKDKKNPRAAEWPEADFVVGNPPFLGGSMIWENLGAEYRDALWKSYEIPNFSDLCCYWFELGRNSISKNKTTRCGLLATQAIRGGANRDVLERIKSNGNIFIAWSDREWTLEGAAVHVSIIGFDAGSEKLRELNGKAVEEINANLTTGLDVAQASPIPTNLNLCLIGVKKAGAFDMEWDQAHELLSAGGNPTGDTNADVLRPVLNGIATTRRDPGNWIIDFGADMPMQVACTYQAPFQYAKDHVLPERKENNRKLYRDKWWLYAETRPTMRAAQNRRKRCLATPYVTKHRLFLWIDSRIVPADGLFIFDRDDDYFFGVVHSSVHELWTRRMGTQLREAESGFRYTPTTCFETFPLPWPPGKENVKSPAYKQIAAAAKELNDLRERWLNPPEWLSLIEEKVDAEENFSDVPAEARPLLRRSAIMARAAKDARLKKRTLTNLYNERPEWLKNAHENLDRAVLAAYALTDQKGDWNESWAQVFRDKDSANGETSRTEVEAKILGNLLRLNGERSTGAVT
jgi:hypothetical protein